MNLLVPWERKDLSTTSGCREMVNYTDTDAPLVKTDWEIAKSSPDTYGRDEREQNKWQADMKLKPHKVRNETEMPTETMQLEDLSKNTGEPNSSQVELYSPSFFLCNHGRERTAEDINICCLPQNIKLGS